MTLKKPKSQPTGVVINDPQDGTFFIGKSDGERPRQVELQAQSLGDLRIYEDGGFHIRSNKSSKKADNIESNSADGLIIYSEGKGIFIEAKYGTITLKAKEIIFESTGTNDPGITINSATNFKVDAADNVKIEGSNVAVAAKNKLIVASKGLLNIRGNGGVLISEPKSKLFPTTVTNIIKTAFSTILPGYF